MSLKWNVSELNKLSNKGLSFEEIVDVNEIKQMNREIRKVFPVQVQGRADFGGKKVTFDLHITGKLILPCSRTLVDVTFPFDIHAKETFALSQASFEEHDVDVHMPVREVVDLMPYVLENILLEIPMQIFNEDHHIKAEAPSSGEGWEIMTENQMKERVDPRLEKLKDFFNEN